jgi:hypothetical protein
MTMSDWRSVQSATHDDLASHQPKDPAWMQECVCLSEMNSMESLVKSMR